MKNVNLNENLMNEYAKNPKRGFEQIYKAYADSLLRYALHSFRVLQEEAEDAVHEALLPWVQKPEQMQEVKNLKAYLYASLRNACLKKKKNLETVSQVDKEPVAKRADIDSKFDIASALKLLPEEQRETVYLKVWGELTFAEIAELQNASLQTVASRYRYALDKLKEILKWNP